MTTFSSNVRIATALAVAVLLPAFAFPAASAQAADTEVKIDQHAFIPQRVAVKAGTTVTWVNLDDEPHTVFSDAGLFRSSALATQEHFSFKFETAGTYHYRCSIHPRMLGTIIVE